MVEKLLRLATDTNVLLDIALEEDDVLDCLMILDQRLPHAEKFVPPSVLEELAYLSDSGDTVQVQGASQKALRQLHEKQHFHPVMELLVPEETVNKLASEILKEGLLPKTEIHDSLILAETAFLNCGILLSSDAHLRGVDHEKLTLLLHPHHLAPPIIATPREIVRKFFR